MSSRARKSRILCPACGKKSWRENGAINRARKQGVPIYCNRKCSGMARRKEHPKTPRNPNFKAMKAEYDREYRKKNREALRKKKHDYFKRTYDPAKAAVKRKQRMPYHVEYCRQPKYKAYKRNYDTEYMAKEYGEFGEAHKALVELLHEINRQQPDREERYRQSQRHGWSPLTHAKRRQQRAERKLNTDSF